MEKTKDSKAPSGKPSKASAERARSPAERCFQAESEARRKGETTAFEKDIYSERRRFEVDSVWTSLIKSEGLHPRWATPPSGAWGRRALEVAMIAALDASQVRLNDLAKVGWQSGNEHAARALGAIDVLLTWMNGKGLDWKQHGARAILNAVHPVTLQRDSASPVAERIQATNGRAQTLIDARVILAGMVEAYPELRNRVTGQNPGQPEKTEFVFVLAEAWAYLLARPPTLNKSFEQLVYAAWGDIGGRNFELAAKPESFSYAMRAAVDRLQAGAQPFDWEPHWIDHPERAPLRDPTSD